jgi:hypothetical protein
MEGGRGRASAVIGRKLTSILINLASTEFSGRVDATILLGYLKNIYIIGKSSVIKRTAAIVDT